MRIMDSSEEDPTPMAVSEAELSQSEDEALEVSPLVFQYLWLWWFSGSVFYLIH